MSDPDSEGQHEVTGLYVAPLVLSTCTDVTETVWHRLV